MEWGNATSGKSELEANATLSRSPSLGGSAANLNNGASHAAPPFNEVGTPSLCFPRDTTAIGCPLTVICAEPSKTKHLADLSLSGPFRDLSIFAGALPAGTGVSPVTQPLAYFPQGRPGKLRVLVAARDVLWLGVMTTVNLKFVVGMLVFLCACEGGGQSNGTGNTGGDGDGGGGGGGSAGGNGGSDVTSTDAAAPAGKGGESPGGAADGGGGNEGGIAGRGGAPADAAPPSDASPTPIAVPAGARLWTGKGANTRFSTPENWSDNMVPSANDDVVLDGGPVKDCVIDKDFAIKSLTVTPKFVGTLNIASPGVITGNMVLSGKIAIAFNPHIKFEVRGDIVDLRNVAKLTTGFAKGSISMTGRRVQTFYPPQDPSVELCELQSFGGSTLKLAAPVKAIGLYVEADGAIDFNGQDVTVKIMGIAGPVTGLAGIKLTVTGFANYTTNGLGFSYHSENKGITNLAPAKPWKLLVSQKTALYGASPNTFTIKNAKVGNLDVSGSDQIKLMNCTDEGGNVGLTF